MLLIIHSIKFVNYNSKNEFAFRLFLRSKKLTKEFSYLPIQEFKNGKNIYLLVQENSFYVNKLFNHETEKILGYCIVEDFREMPCEIKDWANVIFKIPNEVLNQNPVIISDFVIKKDLRKKGLGRRFAEYILFDLYKDANISLQADEDGPFFWPKMGFKIVESEKCIMILNKSQDR